MPRALWTGSISFGLVNIPVRLHAATEAKEVHFHQIHDADGARIQEKRVCSADGKEVAWEHIVKGFEVQKGLLVRVTAEELEGLAPEITHSIEIEQFVNLDEIDPLYYQRSYYVAPDKGAGKAYSLLYSSMAEEHKVGIARVVLRTRQSLCAIRAAAGSLVLSTMQYADEIRDPNKIEGLPVSGQAGERELTLAKQLIGTLAAPFEPSALHDEYRRRVMEFIEKKAAGQEIEAVATGEQSDTQVLSLMDALSASLKRKRDATQARRPAGGRGGVAEASGGTAGRRRKAR